MSIVDLGVAANHLRAELDISGDLIAETLERVEGLVLEHLERDGYEDNEEVPYGVRQAILLALTEAYEEPNGDPLTPAVISLLSPHRGPGVW